jgi:hypothetical protein
MAMRSGIAFIEDLGVIDLDHGNATATGGKTRAASTLFSEPDRGATVSVFLRRVLLAKESTEWQDRPRCIRAVFKSARTEDQKFVRIGHIRLAQIHDHGG